MWRSSIDLSGCARGYLPRFLFIPRSIASDGPAASFSCHYLQTKAWEVRRQILGDTVPLLLDDEQVLIHIRRWPLAMSGRSDALADDTLCLNDELRLCRLMLVGDELLAETLLRTGINGRRWPASAVLAVAVAVRRAQPVLESLAVTREDALGSFCNGVFHPVSITVRDEIFPTFP
jgi:hypothetical protein